MLAVEAAVLATCLHSIAQHEREVRTPALQVQPKYRDCLRDKQRPSEEHVHVVFWGDHTYSFLHRSLVQPFKTDYIKRAHGKNGKNIDLQRSVDEAWQALGVPRPALNMETGM